MDVVFYYIKIIQIQAQDSAECRNLEREREKGGGGNMLLPTLHCRHHNGSAVGSGMSRY